MLEMFTYKTMNLRQTKIIFFIFQLHVLVLYLYLMEIVFLELFVYDFPALKYNIMM